MFSYRLQLTILVILVQTGFSAAKLRAASDLKCYATLDNNVLAIGNTRIRREFEWNKGDLKTILLLDKTKDAGLVIRNRRGDTWLGKTAGKVRSGQWTKKVVENALVNSHLQVEVTTGYEHLDVRRVFRIYPDCAIIGCDYYLRAHQGDSVKFEPRDTVLQMLRLPGAHWRYRAVEFFDRTDRINNLVRETSALAYVAGAELRGNILFGKRALGDTAIVMIKEAPCSFTQLHYPGYDFNVSTRGVQAVGMGVSPGDLPGGKWVRVYGLATGVCPGSETGFLKTLRTYQKRLRRYVPRRDETIMMNTWGDRNRDARIGEEFVNREVDACARLGVTHLQIDDGWQQGLSVNSSQSRGKLWDQWEEANWQPHARRFPRGLAPVVKHAKDRGVSLGLWFHPSNADNYAHWRRDAGIVTNLYRKFGIRYFKIDGIKLPNKQSEINLRRFFDQIAQDSRGQIVINLDATADNRTGYHYFYEYGNIFLENRYTDFGRYYPYWTLRNLWMLSKYVPAEKLQIEFLNKWRNAEKYAKDDPLAPARVPFGYIFATTMFAQPLAWFEGSGLPKEAFRIAPVIETYRRHQGRIHQGTILPIGSEPDGTSWSGFQSLVNGKEGYLLIFREYNQTGNAEMKLHDLAGRKIECKHLCGQGKDFSVRIDADGRVTFSLSAPHSFGLYRYKVTG